jgi:hypothetical protein
VIGIGNAVVYLKEDSLELTGRLAPPSVLISGPICRTLKLLAIVALLVLAFHRVANIETKDLYRAVTSVCCIYSCMILFAFRS